MLQPLTYHQQLLAYLQEQEGELWEWFVSEKARQEAARSIRLGLLKTTYRMSRNDYPELYEAAALAAERLGLDVEPTFYHAQHAGGMNAHLTPIPDEAHIVFTGPILQRLDSQEVLALLGHELSHYLLWNHWDGQYLVVSQVLSALTWDSHAHATHLATARLFSLYNEVFCDRGGYLAADDLAATVRTLVKVETAVEEVNAESFLEQAEEAHRETERSEGDTHPENYIRARALRLWVESPEQADAEIARMIEGPLKLDELDLLGQVRAARLTRRLLQVILQPAWMQTETALNHARLYQPDFELAGEAATESPPPELLEAAPQLADYFCYVLLDFATVDRALEQLPAAHAVLIARQLQLEKNFARIAQKELRMRKKQFATFAAQAEERVAEALGEVDE